MRALAVLAFSNPETAAKIATTIPAARFVAMLNSPEWTDRNKAIALFASLTASRDRRLLAQLRSIALDSLLEMAKWKDLGYAAPAARILARIAGLKEPSETWDEVNWKQSSSHLRTIHDHWA